jgi:hypothetical protein
MIERSRAKTKHDDEAFMELLTGELEKLEPADIIKFHLIFWYFYRVSYRTDLWGAAYIMNGGYSDDAFDYFRGWLISQGKKVFDEALDNPDSLFIVKMSSGFAVMGDSQMLPGYCVLFAYPIVESLEVLPLQKRLIFLLIQEVYKANRINHSIL